VLKPKLPEKVMFVTFREYIRVTRRCYIIWSTIDIMTGGNRCRAVNKDDRQQTFGNASDTRNLPLAVQQRVFVRRQIHDYFDAKSVRPGAPTLTGPPVLAPIKLTSPIFCSVMETSHTHTRWSCATGALHIVPAKMLIIVAPVDR